MTAVVRLETKRGTMRTLGIVPQFGFPVEWLPNYERRGHTVRFGWLLVAVTFGWKLEAEA